MSHIFYIYDGEYPWDVRVEKTINCLTEIGYEVTLVCRNYHGYPTRAKCENLSIERMYSFNRDRVTTINKLMSFPVHIHPLWQLRTRMLLKSARPSLIVVRDLPLAPLAVSLSKRSNIPLVIDLAEPYPETLRQAHKFDSPSYIERLIKNPVYADLLETYVCRYAHGIVVVSDMAKHRLVFKGVKENKIQIVHNSPDLKSYYPKPPNLPKHLCFLEGKKILVYFGVIIGGRGLDILIRGVSQLAGKLSDLYVLIIGDGIDITRIKKLTNDLRVEGRVIFEGWKDNKTIPDYLSISDAGVIPLQDTGHHNITLANKLFDTMACAKPVIASDVLPMKEIINKTGCGLVYRADDLDSLQRTIEAFYNMPMNLRNEMGENGLKAVREKYNWDVDGTVFKNTVKALLAGL